MRQCRDNICNTSHITKPHQKHPVRFSNEGQSLAIGIEAQTGLVLGGSVVVIVKTHDVVFAQILTVLHFDNY